LTEYLLTKVKGKNLEEYSLNEFGDITKSISTLKPTPEIVSSFPVSYTSEAEEPMFEDTILDQKIIKNGTEYYVLKSQTLVDCANVTSYPASFAATKSKLITLSYFNASTFTFSISIVIISLSLPNL
jgi:hypothetical protein